MSKEKKSNDASSILTVRVDNELRGSIIDKSKEMGLNASVVIRMAIENFINGKSGVVLPDVVLADLEEIKREAEMDRLRTEAQIQKLRADIAECKLENEKLRQSINGAKDDSDQLVR